MLRLPVQGMHALPETSARNQEEIMSKPDLPK
jgi:hypothetical protein